MRKPIKPREGVFELEPDAAGAVIDHSDHLSFAPAEGFRHDSDELFRTIDDDQLDRLEDLAIRFVSYYLGLGNLNLITLAAHHFESGSPVVARRGQTL